MEKNMDYLFETSDILLVDDSTDSLKILSEILTEAGYKSRPVEDPLLALEAAIAKPPTLILLDVRMPKLSGFELCRLLKQEERTRDIPIIFVSALEDAEDKVQGFEVGGVDFISKPFQEAEILARVKTHLQLRYTQLHLEEMVANRTAEIKKSEDRYRGLVDNSVVGVFSTTLDGKLLFANEALVEMFDFDSPEQMVEAGVMERWLDLSDRDHIWAQLQEKGSVTNFEAEMVSQTSRKIHALLSVRLIGNTTYGMVIDITKRKKAEAEHDKLFNVSFDLLCIAGFDGYFKELNPAWEKVTGYTLEDLYSKPFADFLHPDDVEKTTKEISKLNEGAVALDFENRYIKKSGEILHLSWTAIPIPEENQMYCIARDITARKAAEKKSHEYQERLRDLAIELTISEERIRKHIAADLHDDVGQMLSSMHMQLGTIIKKEESSELKTELTILSQALMSAIKSTRAAIFDLSPPQLNEIGLYAAVHDWLKEQIDQKHSITTNILGDMDDIQMDENTRYLLFRCIKELANNTVKHGRARMLSVAFKKVDSMLEITVQDDGIGFQFNPDLLNLKSNSFGLFFIQERLSDLGGNMNVNTEVNKGTSITLKIPVKQF